MTTTLRGQLRLEDATLDVPNERRRKIAEIAKLAPGLAAKCDTATDVYVDELHRLVIARARQAAGSEPRDDARDVVPEDREEKLAAIAQHNPQLAEICARQADAHIDEMYRQVVLPLRESAEVVARDVEGADDPARARFIRETERAYKNPRVGLFRERGLRKP